MVFVPEVDAQAVKPEELRPIALCNIDYKIAMS
jgi:hypothetical protein